MNFNADEILNTILALTSTWGLKVLGAILVLIVGRIVASSVRKLVHRGSVRASLDATIVPFLSGLAYYVVLAIVFVAALGMVGIQTASLLAVFGAAGLAVGLALQGTLSNFAAGVMLLLFRPFRVGDYVEAAGTAGTVASVGLFVTTLNTPDNVQILVPNSAVWGDTIKNYAANDTRRNDITVGIAYGDDIGKAMEIVREVLGADGRVLEDPAPLIAVAELADSSVNLVVRPWCKKEDYWGLRFALMRGFKEALEAGGVSIPFPQRDVHLITSTEVGKTA
jgi:small conductance mechanosensitive channel